MVQPENLPPGRSGNPRHTDVRRGSLRGSGAENEEQQAYEDPALSDEADPEGGGAGSGSEFPGASAAIDRMHPAVVEAAGGGRRLLGITSAIGAVIQEIRSSTPHNPEVAVMCSFGKMCRAQYLVGDEEKVFIPSHIVAQTLIDEDYELGWVLAHIHPTKTANPSKNDIVTTNTLAWLGQLMNRPLIDHWIFGHDQSFFSFRNTIPKALTPRVHFEM